MRTASTAHVFQRMTMASIFEMSPSLTLHNYETSYKGPVKISPHSNRVNNAKAVTRHARAKNSRERIRAYHNVVIRQRKQTTKELLRSDPIHRQPDSALIMTARALVQYYVLRLPTVCSLCQQDFSRLFQAGRKITNTCFVNL